VEAEEGESLLHRECINVDPIRKIASCLKAPKAKGERQPEKRIGHRDGSDQPERSDSQADPHQDQGEDKERGGVRDFFPIKKAHTTGRKIEAEHDEWPHSSGEKISSKAVWVQVSKGVETP